MGSSSSKTTSNSHQTSIPKFNNNMSSAPSYITCAQLNEMLFQNEETKPKTLVVDVRDEDRSEGWIPDSFNWPTSELRSGGTKQNAEMMTDFLTKQLAGGKTNIVFHCQWSQMRGPWAAKRALEVVTKNPSLNGKLRILIMQGGFMEWRRCFPELVKK